MDQIIVKLIFLALNNLNGLSEVISQPEVVSLDPAVYLVEPLMQVLETAIVSEVAHLLIGCDENLGLSHGQIK